MELTRREDTSAVRRAVCVRVCVCVGACMRAWVRASVRGCVRERARVCALPLAPHVCAACMCMCMVRVLWAWCVRAVVSAWAGGRVHGVVRGARQPRERPAANLEPLQQRGGELAEAAGAGFIEDGPHERELLRALLVEPTLNKKVKHDLHPFGVRLAEHSAVESGSVLPLHQHRIEAEQQ